MKELTLEVIKTYSIWNGLDISILKHKSQYLTAFRSTDDNIYFDYEICKTLNEARDKIIYRIINFYLLQIKHMQ